MPRELPSYRDNLEDILHFSGGKRLLHINEVCEYLGICYKTAKKQFGTTKDGISAASHKEIQPLTDEEIPLFLKAIEGHPMGNAYALCLFAGLREGECLGLSWNQVDFEARRITISQQLLKEKKKNAQYYIAPTTKSGKPRQVEPPEIAFQYLRAERTKQAENRLAAGPLWSNPENFVFTNEIGKHYVIIHIL